MARSNNTAPTAPTADTGVEHGPEDNKDARDATAKRTAAIARYDAQQAVLEDARGRNDKPAVLSAGAKMSNASARIREAELVLAMAGWTGEPWTKPVIAGSHTRQTVISQAEIEAAIAKLTPALNDPRETVVKAAKQAIGAQLIKAEKRGYTVSDPR